MNAERVRTLLLALPHVVETVQWGDNLVFWVGDKAIGGKMFALLALDAAPGTPDRAGQPLLSFAAASSAAFDDLLEREGLFPAPYFARIKWVSVSSWDALTSAEWHDLLAAAHARVFANHPPKVCATLALPAREQQRQILDRRKLLAAKARPGSQPAKAPSKPAAASPKPPRAKAVASPKPPRKAPAKAAAKRKSV